MGVLIVAIIFSVVPAGHADDVSYSTKSFSTATKRALAKAKTSKPAPPVTTQPTQSILRHVVTIPAHPSGGEESSVGSKPGWTNLPLYDDPTNEATQYYESDPTASGASIIERMGQVPVAEWFGDWDTDIQSAVDSYVSAAAQANAVPVLVLYNIPERDCGGDSTGGAADAAAYDEWVQEVSSVIDNREAVIILEPDALGDIDCLSSADQQSRLQAMSQAVSILKTDPNLALYIDAGNPSWLPVGVMAQLLQQANIAQADGFSLNVSYFDSTASNQAYGDQLSKLVGNKHYVIDTSRNGAGGTDSGVVCNPSSAALGSLPTVNTGDPLNDAWLWIKIPWESDGPCNGGPAPGDVFWTYALQLAENAGW